MKTFQSLRGGSLKLQTLVLLAVSVGVAFVSGSVAAGVGVAAAGAVPLAAVHAPKFDLPWLGKNFSFGVTPKPVDVQLNADLSPEAFAQQIADLKAMANAALKGLPPIEQFESAPELAYAFRCLESCANNFLGLSEALNAKVAGFLNHAKVTAEAKAEASLIEKGEYVKKTDAAAAQDAAVTAKENEVKAAVQAEAAAKAEGEARRQKLVADKVVTAAVAAAIPDEFFAADGYDARLAKLQARLQKLTESKLTAEPFMAEMVALPLDDAGEKLFDTRLKSTQSLGQFTATRPGGGGASLAMPDQPAAGEVELIF